ncbi:hypothetical protein GC56T2_0270 [Geobacillus sp. C56-T2]|nr:hypothetical protein GC56T2_0270 [Geobacillus sp. C56-T2]
MTHHNQPPAGYFGGRFQLVTLSTKKSTIYPVKYRLFTNFSTLSTKNSSILFKIAVYYFPHPHPIYAIFPHHPQPVDETMHKSDHQSVHQSILAV